jgi:hypothetical protein
MVEPSFERTLLLELGWQCNAARNAVESLNQALTHLNLFGILRNLESLLHHSKNAYDLVKSEHLRERFSEHIRPEIGEQLEVVSALRDIVADYEEWHRNRTAHNLVLNNIGPVETFRRFDSDDIFRLYDPESSTFRVRRRAAVIKEIVPWLAGLAAEVERTTEHG